MATRIESILLRARDSLADPRAERWSDDRLLRLLDEGQRDFAKHTRLLKGTYEFAPQEGENEYSLPSDLWLITRASFNDLEINFYSHDTMDQMAHRSIVSDDSRSGYRERERHYTYRDARYWETDTGSWIESLIYDNRNLDTIKVYPIPDENIADASYTFENAGYLEEVIYDGDAFGLLTGLDDSSFVSQLGVVTDSDSIVYLVDANCQGVQLLDDVGFDTPYGIVGEIEDQVKSIGFHGDGALGVVVGIDDYTADSPYGIVTALYDPEVENEVLQSPYGVVTNVDESGAVVRLWYVRLPTTIAATSDSLEIPSLFDEALKFYVIGHALRDDLDVQYRDQGKEFLALYDREVQLAKVTESRDGTRQTQHRTIYRGAFQ